MAHRLVFIKNDEVSGIYTGIQSDKIIIKNSSIIFEDIEHPNIIEINKNLPDKVFIGGEIFELKK